MADIGDVLNAMVGLVATALYPGATVDGSGAALASLAGPVVRVLRGTPFADLLDADLRAGVVNLTVNLQPGSERVTTRFPMEWQVASLSSATLTAVVAGDTVTIGGSVTVGQGVVLIVDGQPYAWQAAAGDSLASIAAGLVAAILVDRPASATGAVVTVLGARQITARIVVQGTAIRPTRQQEAGIDVRVFAPSFALRDQVAGFVDASLSSVIRVALPDSSVGMLRYGGTTYDDQPQKALTYLRSLIYLVEYSTTQTMAETTIGVMSAVVTPGAPGGAPGVVELISDVGPAILPLPSDLAVLMQGAEVQVDEFGNPEVAL